MPEGDHVATAPHELRATLWYPGTLAPYWALSGALLGPPFEGSTELEIPIRRDDGVPKHFRTVVDAICEEASQRFNDASRRISATNVASEIRGRGSSVAARAVGPPVGVTPKWL